jgi:predicted dithiol-disulfide oxidoreductase (DUF899 family)
LTDQSRFCPCWISASSFGNFEKSIDMETSALELQISDLEKSIKEKKKELANLRRDLPPAESKDYIFNTNGGDVRLSDLFGDNEELILVSNMGKSCKYCTLWGDNYNGINKPLNDRASFVVASPDDPTTQMEFASSRNWAFKMVSHHQNNWANENGFMKEQGVYPGVVVYSKDATGKIWKHDKAFFGPGDNYCNMWDFIDLLPSGVNGWQPKYDY